MSKLELFYPVSPKSVNQGFGVNEAYYSKFHDQLGNPEKGHNGIDFFAPHGTPVYAAQDGMATFVTDSHGGEGIIIRTGPYDYAGTTAVFNIMNWHLCGNTDPKYPSPIPTDGKEYPVKAGDLIGHADNTGAPYESTGDHLHFGLIPFTTSSQLMYPANGFNGSIDPALFFNGYFAQSAQSVLSILQSEISLYQKVVALLQKLAQK